MIGAVTRRRLPHLPWVPHLHVNRPKVLTYSELLCMGVNFTEEQFVIISSGVWITKSTGFIPVTITWIKRLQWNSVIKLNLQSSSIDSTDARPEKERYWITLVQLSFALYKSVFKQFVKNTNKKHIFQMYKKILENIMAHKKRSLRKQPTFRDVTNGFPSKWLRRNERRNSILMTSLNPNLGSASDWLKISFNQSEALARSG